MAKKHFPAKARKIEELITFMLERHAVGLLVLCGEEPWPDSQELFDMISSAQSHDELGVRVDGGASLPEAQRVIERVEWIQKTVSEAGGVNRIAEEFQRLKKTSLREWTILRDSCLVKRGRPFSCDDYTARLVAERHHIHTATLRRNRLYIIRKIAMEIVFPGAFTLSEAV